MSRHLNLCTALDAAKAALRRRDYAAADRIRNSVYGSGDPLSWFIAGEIDRLIVDARAEDRRPTAMDLFRLGRSAA